MVITGGWLSFIDEGLEGVLVLTGRRKVKARCLPFRVSQEHSKFLEPKQALNSGV